jgi:REP-associated tyrosine transposase
MPRPRRLVLPEVALHIIQRGNNRAACFREGGDYLVYLFHLRELSAKLECAIHAYCLMTNHVHMLLTPSTATGCIRLMQELGQRYVQHFNRRYDRSGTLWEGRYRSCIAESSRYVLACYRYIELNPLRAGMVQHPRDYAWSSYCVNAGERVDPAITPHAEFAALGDVPSKRYSAYRALFEEMLDPTLTTAIREATNRGYPLCSDEFKSTIARSGEEQSRGSDPALTPN